MFGIHAQKVDSGYAEEIQRHINLAGTKGLELRAAAIFVANPRRRIITLKKNEADDLRSLVRSRGLDLVAHSSYAAYPWGGDYAEVSCKHIFAELKICDQAAIEKLVVHLPKMPISNVLERIPFITSQSKAKIFLETHAYVDGFYGTAQSLNTLFRNIDRRRFGMCFDTAHLWTCGIDMSDPEVVADWLSRLDDSYDKICHLNDSAVPRGCGPDKHATLRRGQIWRTKPDALQVVIDYLVRKNMTAILERKPGADYTPDFEVVAQMVKRVNTCAEPRIDRPGVVKKWISSSTCWTESAGDL